MKHQLTYTLRKLARFEVASSSYHAIQFLVKNHIHVGTFIYKQKFVNICFSSINTLSLYVKTDNLI